MTKKQTMIYLSLALYFLFRFWHWTVYNESVGHTKYVNAYEKPAGKETYLRTTKSINTEQGHRIIR